LYPGVALDAFQPFLQEIGPCASRAQVVSPAQNRVERGAQLMGDRGQEFVFHPTCLFGLLPCFLLHFQQLRSLALHPFALGGVPGDERRSLDLAHAVSDWRDRN
jgi:hypothetical protein